MDNSGPLVLDISSDEETDFGEPRKDGGYGVGGFGDGEDYDWLSRLLVEVGGNKDDDSDDVVVVSEVFANPPKRPRIESLKLATKVVSDEFDDDDCVVLDGDPDKPVVVVNDKAADGNDDDDSDDLEIVGEKGEVACRDFPHARHLCAKFLFASTSHEVHCNQCHCYVCDSLAPCSHWGTGISSIDHCHANDKEEYWKTERKRMKKGDRPVPVIPSINNTPLIDTFFSPQVPALPPPQLNSLLQNQGPNPVIIHPCHRSSNVSGKDVVNQGRVLPSRYVPRYKPQSQFVSQHSHHACNDNIASRAPPQVFRRQGSVRAPQNNRHAYGSQLSRDHPSLRRCHSFQIPAIIGRHGSNQLNIGTRAAHSTLPQLNISASQHQVHSDSYSQTSSQPYGNSSFVNTLPLQPQVGISQPSLENFENLILPKPHVVFQGSSPLPYQAVTPYQSDGGNGFVSQLHSNPMNTPNSGVCHSFETQSSQPQGHNSHSSLPIGGHMVTQQENHTQNGIGTSSTDFGYTWDPNLPCQSAAPADNSQLQSIGSVGHHQSTVAVDNFDQQSIVVADNSSSIIDDTSCHFPESSKHDSLDFQFDSLMFENQTLTAFEVPLSPVWNVFSPEPASVDTGMWCQPNTIY